MVLQAKSMAVGRFEEELVTNEFGRAATGPGALRDEGVTTQSHADRERVILVAEDDLIILMNTAALLEELGHVAIEATSGADALVELRARRDIDLLITDQSMPGMSGSELIAAARALHPDLPIIVASGFGDGAHDGGPGIGKLSKPFGLAELEAAIRASGC